MLSFPNYSGEGAREKTDRQASGSGNGVATASAPQVFLVQADYASVIAPVGSAQYMERWCAPFRFLYESSPSERQSDSYELVLSRLSR